jgi:hypothetical protein
MSRVRVNKLDPFSGQDLTLGGNVVPSNLSASLGSATKFWPSLYVSGNVYFGGLPTCSSTNILVYNPLTGRVCYQTASNFTSTPGGSNRQLQYNNNGVFGGIPNVVYNTTASPSFPSASGANIELTSTDINLITSDVEFGNMGFGVINAVTSISASASSSINPNGLSVYPVGAAQLNYGVNVITAADGNNYCVKMPATPRKGKELTIINKSGVPIYVFGESAAASLNGIIGNHIVLPSDSIAYKFVCYDNPLPGGWSIVSAGASNVVMSDVIGGVDGLLISASIISNPYFSQYNTIINNSMYALDGDGLGIAPWGYDLLNRPQHDVGINFFPNDGNVWSYFTPDPVWRKINTITIYTNLSSSIYNQVPQLNISFGGYGKINYYQAGTTIMGSPALEQPGNIVPAALQTFQTNVIEPFFTSIGIPVYDSWASAEVLSLTQGGSINQVPGALTPVNPSYTPISATDFTGYLSANPGDPGTTYYTANLANSLFVGKGCGIKYLGTVNTQDFFNPSNTSLDAYSCINMGVFFTLPKTTYIDGLKLQIVIDYELLP